MELKDGFAYKVVNRVDIPDCDLKYYKLKKGTSDYYYDCRVGFKEDGQKLILALNAEDRSCEIVLPTTEKQYDKFPCFITAIIDDFIEENERNIKGKIAIFPFELRVIGKYMATMEGWKTMFRKVAERDPQF